MIFFLKIFKKLFDFKAHSTALVNCVGGFGIICPSDEIDLLIIAMQKPGMWRPSMFVGLRLQDLLCHNNCALKKDWRLLAKF